MTELNPPSLEQIKKFAINAALAGGKILKDNFGGPLEITEKKGAGIVTQIDLASEKTIVDILRPLSQEFGFLTEESPPEQPHLPGRWIIDPLDGTTNYAHGFPMFCVSIGVEWQGKLLAGVIYHPILNDLYVAVRGQGATLNSQTIRVSSVHQMREALLTTGFAYQTGESLKAEMGTFARISSLVRAVRRPGSAALDLAYTARGVFDGFWERKLSPWDIAAGALIVHEAGGQMTNFAGQPLNIDQGEVLASNRHLHPLLLKEIGNHS